MFLVFEIKIEDDYRAEVLYSSYDLADCRFELESIQREEPKAKIYPRKTVTAPAVDIYGKKVELKTLKKGELFKRKLESSKVYERGDFCRYERKYVCGDYDDIGRSINLKGKTLVYKY